MRSYVDPLARDHSSVAHGGLQRPEHLPHYLSIGLRLLLARSVSAMLLAVIPASAAQFLIVTRDGRGAWTLNEADDVQINGKTKVRVTAGAGAGDSWDSKAIGRLADEPLANLSAIVRAGDGKLYSRSADGNTWTLLLPDGSNAKIADSAANLWRAAAVTMKHDHKEKTGTPITWAELYAIVPGDPATSAARLATESSLHLFPGVDAPEAFRRMVEFIPAAVKSYPTGKPTEQIRDSVRANLATRLTQWSDGDAPVAVMDECLLLNRASEAAFPADPEQTKLRKQAADTKRVLDRRVAILRALRAGKQAEAFLAAYRDFEPYDKSFPELSAARRAYLNESALAHVDIARRLIKSADYGGAIRQRRLAQLRNPGLKQAGELLEEVRLEIARLSAQSFAEQRHGIDPRSPAQVQLQRRILLAEQYANDGKLAEAEQTLHEAEGLDKDEPKLKYMEAKLAYARGDLGLSLALLDLYAGVAVTQEDFAEGEKLRAAVQYKIENSRAEERNHLKTLYSDLKFATALQSAATGLKLDNEEPEFLYQAGVNACILRHCTGAEPLLHRFLDLTDSSTGVREQRMTAMRLLRQSTADPAAKPLRATVTSWFSGAPLDAGALYDPASLAFQPKVAKISASDHLTINYEWAGGQLHSVHTKYEDKKTGSNIAKLALGVAGASQGLSLPVNWRTTGRETNDFYFNYYDDAPQVYNVSRDNAVVKSHTVPIRIPSFGGFGGFGMLGSMAGLGGGLLSGGGLKGIVGLAGGFGGMRGLGGLSLPAGLPGMAGMAGMGGMPGLGGLAGMVGKGLPGMGGGMGAMSMAGMGLGQLTALRQMHPAQDYSIHNDPQGGSTSGTLALWNNPRVDTRLAHLVTGKRVAVGFSGNHYFHPFAWDAIHLFEFDYDDEGRVRHAWEIDEPNSPRIDFTWSGRRLLSVTAHTRGQQSSVVYSRTLNYSGDKLTSETITHAGKTSHIQYKYNKQGVLIEAECDGDVSLDGRSRKVEFIDETADKGKR